MPFDYEQFYSPWARRRRAAAASPENPATTGVPNPGRSDPYPRFDPDAPARRALGAVAYGEMSGREPQTAAELEEASGVDRRIPDAPGSFGPVRRGAEGSRIVEGTGGAYGYTNGSVEGLYPYGTRTTPAAGGMAGALLSSDRGGVSPAEAARLARTPYVGNRNDSYYEQSWGTAAAEDAIARGRLKVPTLAQTELGRAEAAGDAATVERLRPLVEEQQARIFGRRQEYLGERASDNSLAYHERLGLGAMRSAEAEEAATRRREAEAARMADAELAAQTERARIAAGAPVSFGGGAGAIPNADGGWAVSRPEAAPVAPPAPAPVSFGGGAGAIPDGNGGYTYQGPPPAPADPNAGPWVPGGGASSVNRVTGEVRTAPGAAQGAPVQTGRYSYKDGRIIDTATGEYQELPPRDRKIVVQEMIDQLRREAAKAGDYQAGSYATQIAALEAELRALSGEPDPTPAEAAEVKKKGWWGRLFGGSDEPAPAPVPAPAPAPAPAAEQPAPAPAQPEPAPANPPPADPWAAFGGLYTGK